MATGAQIVTPKQLVILQYLNARRRLAKTPDGWTNINRMESEISFAHLWPDHPKQPIQEELVGTHDGIFPLTGKRNQAEEPYLLTHQSGMHYRITEQGIRMAENCILGRMKTRESDGRARYVVLDKATGKPPTIETTEAVPGIDDSPIDESDIPPQTIVELDDLRRPSPAPQPRQQAQQPAAVASGATGQQEDFPEVEDEDVPAGGQAGDEINDPPPRGGMAAQTTTPTKEKKQTARPPHRKARVPGK